MTTTMQPFQPWQPQAWPPIQPQHLQAQPQHFQAWQSQPPQPQPQPLQSQPLQLQLNPLDVINLLLLIAWCAVFVVWLKLYTQRARQQKGQNYGQD